MAPGQGGSPWQATDILGVARCEALATWYVNIAGVFYAFAFFKPGCAEQHCQRPCILEFFNLMFLYAAK